jgi:DNA-binding NarL/FixJ family response regulator
MTVSLSARDRAVAGLLAQGSTNRQIAAALNVSERTAEWYVARIRAKLGLATRTQVAIWATQRSMGLDPAVRSPRL